MNFEKIFNESTQIKLKDQKVNKTLDINIISKIKTSYGETFLCYNKKYNVNFFVNSCLRAYLNKMIENLKNNDNFYYRDNESTKILQFKIKSIVKDEQGKTKVDLEIVKKEHKDQNIQLPLTDD